MPRGAKRRQIFFKTFITNFFWGHQEGLVVDFLYYLGSIYTMGWVPRPFGATRGEIQTFWFSGFDQSLNPEKNTT